MKGLPSFTGALAMATTSRPRAACNLQQIAGKVRLFNRRSVNQTSARISPRCPDVYRRRFIARPLAALGLQTTAAGSTSRSACRTTCWSAQRSLSGATTAVRCSTAVTSMPDQVAELSVAAVRI